MDNPEPLSMLFGHLGAAANAGAELLFSPDWYRAWVRILLFGALPTALLASPVYMTSILHGRRRGFRAALVPIAILLVCTIALAIGGRWLADGGRLYGMIVYFAWGFIAWLWLPIAIPAVFLGAWRRRVLIRRYRAAGETAGDPEAKT